VTGVQTCALPISFSGNAINLAVQYIDVIRATAN
jgi:hypothetical protein